MILLGKLKEDFLQEGKKMAKKRSVFLHATLRHAVEEGWINEGVGALLLSGDAGSPKRCHATDRQTAENWKHCPTEG